MIGNIRAFQELNNRWRKGGVMFKRMFLIILLAITVTTVVGKEASARVCIQKVGGYCVVWSGSVECGIGATGIGNVANDPVFLGCTVMGIDTMWAAACGNPGSNSWTSPGINLVQFDGILSGTYQLTQDNVDRNGNAYANVFTYADPGLLQEMTEKGACPNTNWSVIDAVPCDMTVRDVQLDAGGCVTSDAFYSCTLPQCGTLTWDSNAGKFERRQYECTRLSTNTYKIPSCPPVP